MAFTSDSSVFAEAGTCRLDKPRTHEHAEVSNIGSGAQYMGRNGRSRRFDVSARENLKMVVRLVREHPDSAATKRLYRHQSASATHVALWMAHSVQGPELAPCDYHLFGKLKDPFTERG
ncbi:hypothetical protein ANN_13814 [Periplaneta americana]|uniref:Uncharacterized protein n=1 Tax=Periplaneta americana TaxID=6978 RepID=A0ABQ8SUK2_PERAM|nr:hypothetical protein ANN_13814 [Periplaneta americana]